MVLSLSFHRLPWFPEKYEHQRAARYRGVTPPRPNKSALSALGIGSKLDPFGSLVSTESLVAASLSLTTLTYTEVPMVFRLGYTTSWSQALTTRRTAAANQYHWFQSIFSL